MRLFHNLNKKLSVKLFAVVVVIVSAVYGVLTARYTFDDLDLSFADGAFENAAGEVFYRPVVKLAPDDESRKKGLMFVRSMGDDEGLLFMYPVAEELAFWMKNTYISLDLIFMNDMQVVHIHKGAEPLSTDLIPSTVPADMVLEVNAGVADERGIQVGHKFSLNFDRSVK